MGRNSQRVSRILFPRRDVALRDAFDISTAVHNMGEEVTLNLSGGNQVNVDRLIEEEEENNDEDINGSSCVLLHHYCGTNGW